MLAKIYSMPIGSHDFSTLERGGMITLQKGVIPSEFKNEDLVFYPPGDEIGVVRELSISADRLVTLKALSRGKEDLVIPFKNLRLCDKVILIRFN
jgi:hypothetical protein